jgi:hypothetical protein
MLLVLDRQTVTMTDTILAWTALLYGSVVRSRNSSCQRNIIADFASQGHLSFTRSIISGTSSSLVIPTMVSDQGHLDQPLANENDRYTIPRDRCLLSVQLPCCLPPHVRSGEQQR